MPPLKRKFPAQSEAKALGGGYVQEGEKSLKDVISRVASSVTTDVYMSNRLYTYMADNHWMIGSSPIMSNAGTVRDHSLISCYLLQTDDSIDSITDKVKEQGMLSVRGGGVGMYAGDIRSVGTVTSKGVKSPGLIPFLKVHDSAVLGFKQGMRRGAMATYLPISHPEIEEFINIKIEGSGNVNRKCFNSFFGVSIPDDFMYLLKDIESGKADADVTWPLVDPHSGEVVKRVSVTYLWERLLQAGAKTGQPYILWSDTVNRFNPLKETHPVTTSNLCSEVTLHTSAEETAVCCLASVNMLHWDEFKDDKQFWLDIVTMLDNVLDIHIENNSDLPTILNGMIRSRDIGVGMLGLHSYFQKMHIPFDSPLARTHHKTIAETFQKRCLEASETLAQERGIPERCGLAGLRRRNLHITAIAPNATSSILMANVSPGIEPLNSNVFDQPTNSGVINQRNPALKRFFIEKGLTPEQRADLYFAIKINQGSVQGVGELDEIMSDYDRDVFKTSYEMSQEVLATYCGIRQSAMDKIGGAQSQSFNMFFRAGAKLSLVHKAHMAAWESGCKSRYYIRSTSVAGKEKEIEECASCGS